jgi:hypothetical protein
MTASSPEPAELSAFDYIDTDHARVVVEFDAVDQTAAGVIVIGGNRVLAECNDRPDSFDTSDLVAKPRCEPQAFGAAHTDRPGRAKHYLGSDISFTLSALPHRAVRQTDSENDQQHADRDAKNTNDRPSRSMKHV